MSAPVVTTALWRVIWSLCISATSLPATSFNHDLHGSPKPPPHKTFVNLWHGDGPKKSKRFANVRSTFVVAGTQLWGRQRPVYFGDAGDGVLVGKPRVYQFARPGRRDDASARPGSPPAPRPLDADYSSDRVPRAQVGERAQLGRCPELSESDAARHLFEQVPQTAFDWTSWSRSSRIHSTPTATPPWVSLWSAGKIWSGCARRSTSYWDAATD